MVPEEDENKEETGDEEDNEGEDNNYIEIYFQPDDGQENVENRFMLEYLMAFMNDKIFDELRTK